MNLLRNLNRKQRATVFLILLLISTSLWVYERYNGYLEEIQRNEAYEKLEEENQLLKYEIDNLTKQNQNLYKVLELKKKLE